MNKFKKILVLLISSLAITGISFIDNKIWNIIFYVLGIIAYVIVGLIFSAGLLHSKNAGKNAYIVVFILLIILGYVFYKMLKRLKLFLIGLALWVKILIPISIFLTIVLIIAIKIHINIKENKI